MMKFEMIFSPTIITKNKIAFGSNAHIYCFLVLVTPKTYTSLCSMFLHCFYILQLEDMTKGFIHKDAFVLTQVDFF